MAEAVVAPRIASAYAYAQSRPTVLRDPSGETIIEPIDGRGNGARLGYASSTGNLPDDRCLSPLCAVLVGRPRVHPIPKRVPSQWDVPSGAEVWPPSTLPESLDTGRSTSRASGRVAPVFAVEMGEFASSSEPALGCADLMGDWRDHLLRASCGSVHGLTRRAVRASQESANGAPSSHCASRWRPGANLQAATNLEPVQRQGGQRTRLPDRTRARRSMAAHRMPSASLFAF